MARCRSLLDSGAFVDAREPPGAGAGDEPGGIPDDEGGLSTYEQWTPLMHAAHRGNVMLAHLLLERGADVNAKTDDGWTAILIASALGQPEILKELLSHSTKPDLNAKVLWNGDDPTALHLAARSGNVEAVGLLMKYSADVNAETKGGYSAPLSAAAAGHWDAVRALLGSRHILKDAINAIAVIAPKRKQTEPEVLNKTMSMGHGALNKSMSRRAPQAPVEEEEKEISPLFLSVDKGEEAITKLLLEKGAHFELHSPDQVDALFGRIATSRHWSILRLILASQASESHIVVKAINSLVVSNAIESRYGSVPLLVLAAADRQVELCTKLIDCGAEVNRQSSAGFTPLQLAVQAGEVSLARSLLEAVVSMPESRMAMLSARVALLSLHVRLLGSNNLSFCCLALAPDI